MKQRFAIDAIYGKPLLFGILQQNFPPVYWKTVQTAPPAGRRLRYIKENGKMNKVHTPFRYDYVAAFCGPRS